MRAAAAKASRQVEAFALRQGELLTWKNAELQERCGELGLAKSGRKAQLVERILRAEFASRADEGGQEEEEAAEEGAEEEGEEQQEEAGDGDEDATKLDRWAEALDQDNLDNISLEEILDLHIHQPGEIVKGRVTSLLDWGAFIELESGWSGLLHISEISDCYVENIEDYLHPGQEVECMVIKNREDRLDRLSLSVRRLDDPPYLQKALAEGQVVSPLEPGPGQRNVTPMSRRMETAEETYQSLECRVAALEAVISQMGHGKALRAAQHEAWEGTKRPAVPSIESLLSSVPEERPQSRQAQEQLAIDAVLRDLAGDEPEEKQEEVTGDLEEEVEELSSSAGGAGDVAAAQEVLEDIKRVEANRRRGKTRPPKQSNPVDDMESQFIATLGL